MPAPKTTLWPLDPHTRAKHEILRRYLEACLAETPFRETHYKRNVLTELERRGVITAVDLSAKRRRGAFPPELRLRFSS